MEFATVLPLGGWTDTWIVVFLDTPTPRRWWHKVLKRGFSHCLALGYDGRTWIQVDCLLNLMDVRTFSSEEMPLVLELLEQRRATALALERTVSRPQLRVPLYCVSAVKHLLGIRTRALTPWQLYKALVARGARPIVLVPHPE